MAFNRHVFVGDGRGAAVIWLFVEGFPTCEGASTLACTCSDAG